MSALLLDTHVLILWLEDPHSISVPAREAILSESRRIVVSVATIWEMTIKRATGRLQTPDDLLELLATEQFEVLPVFAHHALAVGDLPPHHRDPFDRLLVAQAQTERLTIVTRDKQLRAYGVACLPA